MKIAIVSAFISWPQICTPLFLAYSVTWRINAKKDIIYFVDFSELARAGNGLFIKNNFCLYSVILKLIPCALLSVLSQYCCCVPEDQESKAVTTK
jgi:hypothetical protein